METNIIASSIIGGTGLIITAWYSFITIRISRDRMMKELFTEFNQRYDNLNESLSLIRDKYPTHEELSKADNLDFLKHRIIDFFNLCAEEYFWSKHKKRINRKIWRSWQNGMNYWYKNVPVIRETWEQETADKNGLESYYIKNKFTFFKQVIKPVNTIAQTNKDGSEDLKI